MPRSSSRDWHCGGGLRLTHFWKTVHSLFIGGFSRRMSGDSRVSVVALVLNEQDRHVLASVFGQEPFDVRFAESCEEAYSVANHLIAPIILLDRDWPGTEWRAAVTRLASPPHRLCVLLVSGVCDAYLSQELARRRGHDLLLKPLHADRVERTVRLALPYWNSAANRAVRMRDPRK